MLAVNGKGRRHDLDSRGGAAGVTQLTLPAAEAAAAAAAALVLDGSSRIVDGGSDEALTCGCLLVVMTEHEAPATLVPVATGLQPAAPPTPPPPATLSLSD